MYAKAVYFMKMQPKDNDLMFCLNRDALALLKCILILFLFHSWIYTKSLEEHVRLLFKDFRISDACFSDIYLTLYLLYLNLKLLFITIRAAFKCLVVTCLGLLNLFTVKKKKLGELTILR